MWSGLFCALDLAILKARSCHLLWTHRDPPREGELPINHSYCHNLSCLLEFLAHGRTAHRSQELRGSRLGAKQPEGCSVFPCTRPVLLSTPDTALPHPLCPVPSAQLQADPQRHSGTRTRAPLLPRVLVCGMLLCWQKSRWESCSYPEIRHDADNGSPSSSRIPVKGTLFLNNLRNI